MSNNKKQPILLLSAIILTGAAILITNYSLKPKTSTSNAPSNPASSAVSTEAIDLRPDFTLPDETGLPHDISEWDGKIIVLNFWATWCRPCLREMPMLSEFQQHYADKNVQFIGISFDDREAVKNFSKHTKIDILYPNLIGEDEAIAIAKAYQNISGILPFTVIIDANGGIQNRHYGEISREQLAGMLDELI